MHALERIGSAEAQVQDRHPSWFRRVVGAVASTALILTLQGEAGSVDEPAQLAKASEQTSDVNYETPAVQQAAAKPELPSYKIEENTDARPNIILILADDLDSSLLKFMPQTINTLQEKGMTATNYINANSLCCPSRVSLLRGQYMHNTGHESNTMPKGGFERFRLSGQQNSTIATWLKDGGYDTAFSGKYLNSYPYRYQRGSKGVQYVPPEYVPPGWTDWLSPVEGSMYAQTMYKLNINGVVDAKFRNMNRKPRNYMMYAMEDHAVQYIWDHADDDNPYFMYWAPTVPHYPSTYPKKFDDAYVDTSDVTEDPAFNELDVSDKSLVMRQPRLTRSEIKQVKQLFTDRARSTMALDESLTNMIDAVEASGQLDDTYFIVATDNGFHLGHHRLAAGKNTPYETDINTVFMIMGPGVEPGSVSHKVFGNIDVAPTFARLAGVRPGHHTDGQSIVPILKGRHPKDFNYRLIERGDSQNYSATADGMSEPADNPKEIGPTSTTPFKGVRSRRFMYVVYDYQPGKDNSTKEAELYDLYRDRSQLENLLHEDLSPFYARKLARLQVVLATLATCRAVECRL